MNEDTRQFVAFTVGPHHLAADIGSVKEILRPVTITPLPAAPEFIEGVIDLRGAVIPVMDLRKRFSSGRVDTDGLDGRQTDSDPKDTEHTRYVIAAIQHRIFALVVDEVTEVVRLPSGQVRSAPGMGGPNHPVTHVFQHQGKLHMVLDLSRLLSGKERLDLEDFAKGLGARDARDSQQGPIGEGS